MSQLHPSVNVKQPNQGADIALLQEEIETEAYDEELFQIFFQQLQKNISQLRLLVNNFPSSQDKQQLISQCSVLISRLHSSANYIGYDQLTKFYGQWIAELERASQELSKDNPASFDFMNYNIRIIDALFPKQADIETHSVNDGAQIHPSPPPLTANNGEQQVDPLAETSPDDLSEDSHLIAAQTGEDPPVRKEEVQIDSSVSDLPDLEQKLDLFFGDTAEPQASGHEPNTTSAPLAPPPSPPARPLPDTAALKEEIASEECDEELFHIFFQQLQDNISKLSSLVADAGTAQNITLLIKQCSDLVSALNSSANYMGYERLAEFYGNWLAELEMTDLHFSMDNSVTFDFMDANIRTIYEVFPQLSGMKTEPEKNHVASNDEYDRDNALFTDDEDKEVFISDEPTDQAGITVTDPDTDARRKQLLEQLSGALQALDSTATDPEEEGTDLPVFPSEPLTAEPVEESRLLYDRLSKALDEDEHLVESYEDSAAIGAETDLQLFAKLSHALDRRGFDQKTTGLKSIDDVINEILTGDGLTPAGVMAEQPDFSSAFPEENDVLIAEPPALTAEEHTGFPSSSRTIDADRRHGPEDRRSIESLQPAPMRNTILVDTDKIDQLMDRTGELIVSQTKISQLHHEMSELQEYLSTTAGLKTKDLQPLHDYALRLNQADDTLGRLSSELQEGVVNVRMLPIAQLFKQYPRMIRELAARQDKKVNLIMRGEETLLDKIIMEKISSPLLQIIRNCIDHGIERAEERVLAGKDETATLLLEAYPDCNTIVIEISDDGRGMEPQKIKEKALERNILSPDELEGWSENELLHLIMTPGFSTKNKTTGTSGQDEGMNAVRNNIEKINGSIAIRSQAGVGTTFRIVINLALSVTQTLAITIGSRVITVPLTNVEETARVRHEDITVQEGVELIEHRGATLPLLRVADILKIPAAQTHKNHAYILVVNAKGQRAGLVVDGFIRPRETIIKPLAEYLRKESGFCGATIRDDGTISLVLDIATLIDIAGDRLTGDGQKEKLDNAMRGEALV